MAYSQAVPAVQMVLLLHIRHTSQLGRVKCQVKPDPPEVSGFSAGGLKSPFPGAPCSGGTGAAVAGVGRWRAPCPSAVPGPAPQRGPSSARAQSGSCSPFTARAVPSPSCLPIALVTSSGLPTPPCLKALFLLKSELKLPSVKARLTPST